jgi:hypothetical protein
MVSPATMASADSCQPIPSPHDAGSSRQTGRPPRVRRVTSIPYTRRIYFRTFRMAIGLQVTLPPRPGAAASYAVSVRRAGTLPAASFRSRVAPDTLAVQLTVPAIRARGGLQPPSPQSTTTVDQVALSRHAPCLAYNSEGAAGRPLSF